MKNIIFKPITLLTFAFLMIFTGCSKDEPKNPVIGSLNNLSLGVSANDLLSDENYTSLKIEVVYVDGYEPSKTALDNLKDFLSKRTYKPGGISISKRAIPSPGNPPYSLSEIQNIEDEQRTAFTEGNEIAVFIFYADGEKEDSDTSDFVLGSAYKNTSIVIFEKTVQELSSQSLVSKSRIETTSLMHEFGHLFGLVNNGSPSKNPHEDTENDGHCNVSGCLMAASVSFGPGTLAMLKTQQHIGFDEKCIEDLRANGGK